MSWQEITLGELCEFRYGKGLPEKKRIAGVFPVYGSAGLVGTHSSAIVKGPGIVVGRKGSIGKVYKEKRDFFPIDTVYYIEKSHKYDLDFLYYLLINTPLSEMNSDAAVPGLNRNRAYSEVVKVPNLQTQKKIAGILGAYDDLIENNLRRIDLLEDAARTLYREWFVHFCFPGHATTRFVDGLPEGWEKKPFDELADFLNGFAFKPAHLGDEGLPIVKIPELREGIRANTPRNSGETIPAKYILNSGDLLFSWSGTLLINFWNSGPALLNQHLFKVTPKLPRLEFLLITALREKMGEFLLQSVGATMHHIRRSSLSAVSMIMPSKPTLEQYLDITEPLFKQIATLQQQNQKLAQARDALLPKLMKEEIEV